MARPSHRGNRLVRTYKAVRVGSTHELIERSVSPWHEPSKEYPMAEKWGHPIKVMLRQLIQNRADELEALEPADDPDAHEHYTRAENERFAWLKRTRLSGERLKRHLERELFGPIAKAPKTKPRVDSLLAEFQKLPERVKHSKLAAAKRLQPMFPDMSIQTIRKLLAKVGKDSAAIR
jgi:hypothetical protein